MTPAQSRIPGRPSDWLLLGTLAIGLAVRVYRLDAQSLWNDEGNAVMLARRSLPAIVTGAANDIHPPLYFFLLHFWMQLAGDSEFALRFLSVLAGVLLIAVTYRVARTLFIPSPIQQGRGKAIAILAALLSALSAFQLYYSQETRMYILVALWSALAMLGLTLWLKSNAYHVVRKEDHSLRTTKYALLYLLATLAALYTHYFAFTLVILENLIVGVWLLLTYRARRSDLVRTVGTWIGAQIIIVLAYLPWLAFAGRQLTSWPAISDKLSLPDLTTRVLSAFTLGVDIPAGNQVYIVALFGLLFLAGIMLSLRRYGWAMIVTVLWAVTPLAAMYVLSLQRPAYMPKFLLLATPGFFILVAQGVVELGSALSFLKLPGLVKFAPAFILGAVVLLSAMLVVNGIYFDPRLQRDDYRGVIGYINRVATTDDAVLVDAPGQMDVFSYYYHGTAQVQALPVGRPLDIPATQDALQSLVAQRHNLYGVYWATDQADPDNVIGRYLSVHAYGATDEWHGDIRLAQYALPSVAINGQAQPSDATFGDAIKLARFTLPKQATRVGTIVPLSFEWLAVKHPAGNYKVFVHLLDRQSKIVSQHDSEPQAGFRPTGTWNESETITDLVGLLIPAGTPPGDYTVEVGLYRGEDAVRLPVSTGGDHLILGTVRVEE